MAVDHLLEVALDEVEANPGRLQGSAQQARQAVGRPVVVAVGGPVDGGATDLVGAPTQPLGQPRLAYARRPRHHDRLGSAGSVDLAQRPPQGVSLGGAPLHREGAQAEQPRARADETLGVGLPPAPGSRQGRLVVDVRRGRGVVAVEHQRVQHRGLDVAGELGRGLVEAHQGPGGIGGAVVAVVDPLGHQLVDPLGEARR